jgi:hypothetical protein
VYKPSDMAVLAMTAILVYRQGFSASLTNAAMISGESMANVFTQCAPSDTCERWNS